MKIQIARATCLSAFAIILVAAIATGCSLGSSAAPAASISQNDLDALVAGVLASDLDEIETTATWSNRTGNISESGRCRSGSYAVSGYVNGTQTSLNWDLAGCSYGIGRGATGVGSAGRGYDEELTFTGKVQQGFPSKGSSTTDSNGMSVTGPVADIPVTGYSNCSMSASFGGQAGWSGSMCGRAYASAGSSSGSGGGGGGGGNCSAQCPSNCDPNVPAYQACLYCQAACLCKCAGDSSCCQSNASSAASLGTTCGTTC
jgi:hypothetical protein